LQIPPAGNGKSFARGPENWPPKFPKPHRHRYHCLPNPRERKSETLAMVIAVEGNGFVHGEEEEEEGDRPIRYLPLGYVYSSSAPAPAPAPCPPAPKKPRVDDGKPPLKVYYRRRHKKPRVEEPPPPLSPATTQPPPLVQDGDARPSWRKGSLNHELLSLGSAPPSLDGDGEGRKPSLRQWRMRRGGGVEKTACFSGHDRRRPGRPKGSVGRRWVE
jgi:hypothetical protein